MKKKCPHCKLINFATAEYCLRCKIPFRETGSLAAPSPFASLLKRGAVCAAVVVVVLVGFYLSLIGTAKPLEYEHSKTVERAVRILEAKGFDDEVFLLRHLTVFRAEDNWLNASVAKENAYAATNFPFEIMTLYPDFFTYPADDTERAAILLHESKHLEGADEKEAYEFVWRNRSRLGWTVAAYGHSPVWLNVRKQTREVVPELFACPEKPFADCTEL